MFRYSSSLLTNGSWGEEEKKEEGGEGIFSQVVLTYIYICLLKACQNSIYSQKEMRETTHTNKLPSETTLGIFGRISNSFHVKIVSLNTSRCLSNLHCLFFSSVQLLYVQSICSYLSEVTFYFGLVVCLFFKSMNM